MKLVSAKTLQESHCSLLRKMCFGFRSDPQCEDIRLALQIQRCIFWRPSGISTKKEPCTAQKTLKRTCLSCSWVPGLPKLRLQTAAALSEPFHPHILVSKVYIGKTMQNQSKLIKTHLVFHSFPQFSRMYISISLPYHYALSTPLLFLRHAQGPAPVLLREVHRLEGLQHRF